MLTFDDGGAFRVGANLDAEPFQDGAIGNTESFCHIWKVRDVGLHTIQSRLLLQLHLRHFVAIVGIVVFALRDANVGCHFELLGVLFSVSVLGVFFLCERNIKL